MGKFRDFTRYGLSEDQICEVREYINIFEREGFSEHYEVNNWISSRGLWGKFPNMRSINTHRSGRRVLGIEPRYFSIVCAILELHDFKGSPLDDTEKY